MFKIKHERTADCVVAGYRVHKSGENRIGSLLLGLYNAEGVLASVGVIGAFPMARREELFEEMQELVTDFDNHPWAWAKQEEGNRTPRNAEGSRWQAGKDLTLRAAAPGAGRGGQVRPHGRRPLPSHRPVRPLARGPHAGVLHLRTTRGAGQVRPRRRPHRTGRRLSHRPATGRRPCWTGEPDGTDNPGMTAERIELARPSDAERDHALAILRDGAGSGRLSHDTFIRRMNFVLRAQSRRELAERDPRPARHRAAPGAVRPAPARPHPAPDAHPARVDAVRPPAGPRPPAARLTHGPGRPRPRRNPPDGRRHRLPLPRRTPAPSTAAGCCATSAP